MRATRAIIDLAAIRHNFQQLRRLAPKRKVMAVIKADAYGHGILPVAKSLQAADLLAVACMDEAVKLRAALIRQPILLLEGFFDAGELRQLLELNLDTVVHQQKQVDEILQLAQSYQAKKKMKVWLKLDTGMNRLGFNSSAFQQAYDALKNCDLVESVSLMSHLACADEIDNPMNLQQIKSFRQITQSLQEQRSMANSAGIIAWPESHFDWVRPGISLYGCSPMRALSGKAHHFKPAMTLQSQLLAIHSVEAGATVGYGASWQATQSTQIGVVAIGYGDGYPRHAREGTPVLINGRKYPLVGKVSMDMLTVDLGCDEQFEIGDQVILWGDGLAAEEIAGHADTIAYTLLCGVTSRVNFEWIE